MEASANNMVEASIIISKLCIEFDKAAKQLVPVWYLINIYLFKTSIPMKKLNLLMLTALVMTLSSCDAIAGIFKAGAVVGIIAVVIVIGLILWILSMFRGRS